MNAKSRLTRLERVKPKQQNSDGRERLSDFLNGIAERLGSPRSAPGPDEKNRALKALQNAVGRRLFNAD